MFFFLCSRTVQFVWWRLSEKCTNCMESFPTPAEQIIDQKAKRIDIDRKQVNH